MNRQFLQTWWQTNQLGRYVCKQEYHFVQKSIAAMQPERVLHLGLDLGSVDLPVGCAWIRQDVHLPAEVIADTLAMPWQQQSFDVVVAVHELDCLMPSNWQCGLIQIWRVLQPNGRLILTGFNRYSLWRLGGWAPDVAKSVRLYELKRWLVENGWQIEQGQFLNYLPAINSNRWIEKLQFLESMGNRWWPSEAAVYALVLRKDVLGAYPSEHWLWDDSLDDELTMVLARDEFKS